MSSLPRNCAMASASSSFTKRAGLNVNCGCAACGSKVYDVDERQCQDCTHSRKLWDGTICNKHLMRVTPDMNVTFQIADGTCWTARA